MQEVKLALRTLKWKLIHHFVQKLFLRSIDGGSHHSLSSQEVIMTSDSWKQTLLFRSCSIVWKSRWSQLDLVPKTMQKMLWIQLQNEVRVVIRWHHRSLQIRTRTEVQPSVHTLRLKLILKPLLLLNLLMCLEVPPWKWWNAWKCLCHLRWHGFTGAPLFKPEVRWRKGPPSAVKKANKHEVEEAHICQSRRPVWSTRICQSRRPVWSTRIAISSKSSRDMATKWKTFQDDWNKSSIEVSESKLKLQNGRLSAHEVNGLQENEVTNHGKLATRDEVNHNYHTQKWLKLNWGA